MDFIPLLYEDKKQSTRALRADVQNTPLGPEVLLAAPLYDGTDFLGVVAAYFDMRTLLQYSQSPEDMVILSPQALLWPGKYDFAATPLASVNWDEVVTKSSSGHLHQRHGRLLLHGPLPGERAFGVCPCPSQAISPRVPVMWGRAWPSSPRSGRNCRPRPCRNVKIKRT